jgi:hypothetical protein
VWPACRHPAAFRWPRYCLSGAVCDTSLRDQFRLSPPEVPRLGTYARRFVELGGSRVFCGVCLAVVNGAKRYVLMRVALKPQQNTTLLKCLSPWCRAASGWSASSSQMGLGLEARRPCHSPTPAEGLVAPACAGVTWSHLRGPRAGETGRWTSPRTPASTSRARGAK